ncbi:hypothetical protein A3C37_05270 [Candidatus Peribacteria bacterium RIFCSPHIGHO2_02_FULL_53_20]|nr:MAG: hypothetical protein A3C37_05270 [Candidatus Peribacteria bacterium RIFCSPHIGHO2_02_FULL_53_20]
MSDATPQKNGIEGLHEGINLLTNQSQSLLDALRESEGNFRRWGNSGEFCAETLRVLVDSLSVQMSAVLQTLPTLASACGSMESSRGK